MFRYIQEHLLDNSDSYTYRFVEFLHTNIISIITMISGITIGETSVHHNLSYYLTDISTLELIKTYIGIVVTLSGFILMIYNTFFRKRRK